jgi:copper/silver efflux system protein
MRKRSRTASAMQHIRDRQSGRLMTSLLALALAAFTFVSPGQAAAANLHACCARLAKACPMTTLQCCEPSAPARPTQAPPPQVSSAPAPDLAPLLPAAAVPPPATAIIAPLVANPPRPVSVRYARDFRDSVQSVGTVLVPTPSGNVPLAELARISIHKGPAMIRDENGLLAGYVYVDTAAKDLGGYVKAAQAAVRDRVTLPQGYRLDWTGQYEFQVRARERLQLLVPAVFTCILLLLYLTFHSLSEAVIVMLSVVYAMSGGVIAQWWLGYNFSVAVWVGYIALYGIAVQTGVVMVIYLHEALDRRLALGPVTARDIWDATITGSVLRLRPKLMTVAATTLSLLPIMWSTSVGSDVMKPIAAPIIGGMVTSTIHVLIVTPVIFYVMKLSALKRGTLRTSRMSSIER